MPPLRIGVAVTRAGQGSTGYGLALAWSSARDRSTILIDADGAGGTVADMLGLDDRRSLQNIFSPHGVTTADLQRQAVAVPGRPQFRVVPGFRDPGPGAEVAELLEPAVSGLREELAVVDLGAPFAYPELSHRERSVHAVAAAFHALFVVVRVEDDLLAHAIRTLSVARIPRARLVLVRPPHRRGVDEAIALLRERLPEYPVAGEWEWNVERWVQARARRQPVSRDGLAEELGLFGLGSVVDDPSVRRRRRFGILPAREVDGDG